MFDDLLRSSLVGAAARHYFEFVGFPIFDYFDRRFHRLGLVSRCCFQDGVLLFFDCDVRVFAFSMAVK